MLDPMHDFERKFARIENTVQDSQKAQYSNHINGCVDYKRNFILRSASNWHWASFYLFMMMGPFMEKKGYTNSQSISQSLVVAAIRSSIVSRSHLIAMMLASYKGGMTKQACEDIFCYLHTLKRSQRRLYMAKSGNFNIFSRFPIFLMIDRPIDPRGL
jgi:hypothetical protein